ncbi:MAG: transcriptional regulator GcvA [Alphaproteobacteria bacterium]|nr:transcriptional regulator GcvA [Alphaproteobacteria bacterium]
MYKLPPLNGLRAFEAAARNLSFAKAAAELHVTPAAVSYQIRALEDHLGVKLFRRLNRAIVLTDAGALAFPGVRGGFEELHRAVSRIGRAARTDQVVVVTMAPHFAAKWLAPRLARFIERHPNIDLRISAGMTNIDLTTDQADVAVRYNLGNNDGLVAEKLMNEAATPMCRPEMIGGDPPLRTPADLERHTLIHYVSQSPLWPDIPGWSKWLALAGLADLDASAGLHFDHADHCLDAAIEGSGVVLGRRAIASRDLEQGRLVAPFDLDLPFPGGIYSITTSEKVANPNVSAFRDWLREEAASTPMGAPMAA